jgi:hypothetical protein
MTEDYQYDENGFREDLKDNPDVLHQPDADRTQRDVEVLDYDDTLAVLEGKKEVATTLDFSDEVLDKIRKDHPQIDDTLVDRVIMDKYQQILIARYNQSQADNQTIHAKDEDSDE